MCMHRCDSHILSKWKTIKVQIWQIFVVVVSWIILTASLIYLASRNESKLQIGNLNTMYNKPIDLWLNFVSVSANSSTYGRVGIS